MYAHEAIKSVEKFIPSAAKIMKPALIKISDLIKNSQMFHFGEANSLDKLFGPKTTYDSDPFLDPLDRDLRLPYPICWFDYDTRILPGTEEEIKQAMKMKTKFDFNISSRKGFLIAEILPTELIACISFSLSTSDIDWAFTPVVYYIVLGKELKGQMKVAHAICDDTIMPTWMQYYPSNTTDDNWLVKGFTGDKVKNIWPCPIMDPQLTAEAVPSYTVAADMINLKLIELSLRLLNCKNIVSERIERIYKVKNGKKTKKIKSKRKYAYHILNVTKPSERKCSHNSTSNHTSVRVHLCRGHYRHYTDKGLFGKYFGRFWIQDHVRGNKSKGLLTKDYNIIGKEGVPIQV